MKDKDTHLLEEAYNNIIKQRTKQLIKETINIKLPEKWIDYILNLPETGMGYQTADIYFNDGTVEHNVIIMNGEVAVDLPDNTKNKQIVNIKLID